MLGRTASYTQSIKNSLHTVVALGDADVLEPISHYESVVDDVAAYNSMESGDDKRRDNERVRSPYEDPEELTLPTRQRHSIIQQHDSLRACESACRYFIFVSFSIPIYVFTYYF